MNDVIDSLEQVSNALKNIKSTNEYLELISENTKQELEKVEDMLHTIDSMKEETSLVNQQTEKKLLEITSLLNEKISIISDSIKNETNIVNKQTEKKLLGITSLLNEKIRVILDSITDLHNQYIKYVGNQFENMAIETNKINSKIDFLKEFTSKNQDSLLSQFNETNTTIENARDLIEKDAAENMKTLEGKFNAYQEICEKRFYILMSTIFAGIGIAVIIALFF